MTQYSYLRYTPEIVARPTGAREFVGVRRFKFLNRLLKWAFVNLSSEYLYKDRSYRTETVTEEKVVELVRSCSFDMRRLCAARGGVVVCGPKQWKDALNDPVMRMYPMEMRAGFNREPMLLGMRVLILPWFDGVVVIPDGMLEEKRVLPTTGRRL